MAVLCVIQVSLVITGRISKDIKVLYKSREWIFHQSLKNLHFDSVPIIVSLFDCDIVCDDQTSQYIDFTLTLHYAQ